ncbi:ComEA family DNA-binding protein [Jeongeupia naejangsanensis]|uniref:Helix-hairpin-helix domain-containing protein n=1 Tax=Jeongeupia naejangsanensis TaxID=613195 RepID=A0ABS2BKX8_9NEIS|nr:helix-hairpin-helix domain-containing protein [Jeongeupia naejangsanensis]MBM3116268.1 helix-hairpin-helix domain-containing protein [Jeongeupia naejangsanensis]
MKKWLAAFVGMFLLCASVFAAVDLNTATEQQLEGLNGIGPTKAKSIVDYRTKNGAFKTPEDIMKVPGIKEGTFNKIKGDISVGGKVAAPAATAKSSKATASPAAAKPASTKEAKPKASAPAKK